jgi:transcriptional regulator with XRE-family HTH domain
MPARDLRAIGRPGALYVAFVAEEAPTGSSEVRFRRELSLALRHARERLRMSQDEFAKTLGHFLGRPISSSYVADWEHGVVEPTASALLAAAELTGLSVDELRGAAPAAVVARLERLEVEVERLTHLEARVEKLLARVEGPTPYVPAAGGPMWGRDELEREIGQLEADITEIGRRLRRHWSEPFVTQDATAVASPFQRVFARIGTLESRMMEVAGVVGAPSGGYPRQPDPAAGEEVVLAWVEHVVTMLQQQMPAVLVRARDLRRLDLSAEGYGDAGAERR